jgi:hypothetical protein
MLLISSTFIVCSSSNGPEDDDPELNSDYFPMNEGDTWYFTVPVRGSVVRTVEGDTTIADAECVRIRENGETVEAWSVIESGEEAGFYVHLLTAYVGFDTLNIRFEPPLKIPFYMEESDIYKYTSTGYYLDDGVPYYFEVEDSVRFEGFVSKTVTAGDYSESAKIYYMGDDYFEWYGKNLGLLDNEDYVLDSAYIDGKWYR